ncbi:MAG TPA: hypothetical protein VFR15_16165 [Chloroflexia bacterium]|nr:hypothetical protein [Chloroflexia bacterium]
MTDGEGRAPAGPFWGGWEARYNMGGTSSALPEPSQTVGTEVVSWSVPWHEGSADIIRGGSEVTMQLWVAARGYVPAVVTGTLPSTLPEGVPGAVDTPTPIRSIPPVPTAPTGSSGAPTPTIAADFLALARGFWEPVPESTRPPGGQGRITSSLVYAIDFASNGVSVRWDNGLTCPTLTATVSGDTLWVIEGDSLAEFKIHDADDATVTFWQGDKIGELRLRKTRDDPRLVCY